jgi:hypothetical protein
MRQAAFHCKLNKRNTTAQCVFALRCKFIVRNTTAQCVFMLHCKFSVRNTTAQGVFALCCSSTLGTQQLKVFLCYTVSFNIWNTTAQCVLVLHCKFNMNTTAQSVFALHCKFQHQEHNSLALGCKVGQLHILAPKFCMYQWDSYFRG